MLKLYKEFSKEKDIFKILFKNSFLYYHLRYRFVEIIITTCSQTFHKTIFIVFYKRISQNF